MWNDQRMPNIECPIVRHVIRHSSFVIRHSSFVIRHPSSVIRHSSFVIRHSSFVIRHPSFACVSFADRHSRGSARALAGCRWRPRRRPCSRSRTATVLGRVRRARGRRQHGFRRGRRKRHARARALPFPLRKRSLVTIHHLPRHSTFHIRHFLPPPPPANSQRSFDCAAPSLRSAPDDGFFSHPPP